MHPLLGGDQLLGLAGEAFLGHPQDLVDVGAAFGVRELELPACLDLLEAPVQVRVLL